MSGKYLPLYAFIFYSVFVVMASVVAPLKYIGMDYSALLSFLLPMLALFAIGYCLGVRKRDRHFVRYGQADALNGVGALVNYILILAVINSCWEWQNWIVSGRSLDFEAAGANYVDSYDGYVRGQASIGVAYVLGILGQAITTAALLFSFCSWRTLSAKQRGLFLFVLATYLLIGVIGGGKQKYLGDVLMFWLAAYMLSFLAEGKKFGIKFMLFIVAVGITGGAVFVILLSQRYAAAGIDIYNIDSKIHPLNYWDAGSQILDFTPEGYELGLGMFLNYFSNGLFGLNLSLQLPFEWSYFVGNSYSIGRLAEILMGSDQYILSRTYPFRVGEAFGWGFDKWHSIFSWLASDFTFTGVLLITPVFSYFYGRVWCAALSGAKPYAAPLFIYLSLGLVFSYSNNQLVHSLSGVIVLLFLICGYARKSGAKKCAG